MSRFHQRLRKDLQDPEFAAAFYDMSVDIALLVYTHLTSAATATHSHTACCTPVRSRTSANRRTWRG